MTALRVPTLGVLGFVAMLTGGLAVATFARHCPHAGSPELAEPPAADEPNVETRPRHQEQEIELTGCEAPNIRNVVLRGQFIAHETVIDHFAIQLPGKSGSYSAITDQRGYFEMRIPREDFVGDLCSLDWWHSFSDESMTLQYIVDFE